MEKAALFWSGGKDCAYALHTVIKENKYHVETLVTTLNRQFRRISMHGVREEMLDKQAEALQIPILKMWVGDIPTNENYEMELIKTYKQLKSQGIDVIIFGDIFLQDLRLYREKLLSEAGLKGYFPLWERDTGELIKNILAHGFRTVTCCISTVYLDKSWAGRELNKTFIEELPPGVDPCGENGEFHTFCFAGPIFNHPIKFIKGIEKYSPLVIKDLITERETGFWFVDILEDE